MGVGLEVSSIIGRSPRDVVSDVSMIGRRRRIEAHRTASNADMPSSRLRFAVTTSTRLSFTTTPVSAMIPKRLMSDTP